MPAVEDTAPLPARDPPAPEATGQPEAAARTTASSAEAQVAEPAGQPPSASSPAAEPTGAAAPSAAQAPVPETARLGITLRGVLKLRAQLTEDFAAGRVHRPASGADWPETVEGLRTEQVNLHWVKKVTQSSLNRLVELQEYVAPQDVAPPDLFVSHACE